MNFREEYKNDMQIAGPSAEQLERMKSNVLAQTAEPVKKTLPLKRIAAVGGAVAACAVISVAAVNILPRLSAEDVSGGGSYAANAADAAYMDGVDFLTDSDEEKSHTSTAEGNTYVKISEDCAADASDFEAMNDLNEPEEAVQANGDSCVFDNAQCDEADNSCCEEIDSTCGNAAFELDADMNLLIWDNVKYILADGEDFALSGEAAQTIIIEAGETEYRLEIYGDEYIALSRSTDGGFEAVGKYMRADTQTDSTDCVSDETCCEEIDSTCGNAAFELDADMNLLIWDNVKYILADGEDFALSGEATQTIIIEADETEYCLEIYDECIVLSLGTSGEFEAVGKYMKTE